MLGDRATRGEEGCRLESQEGVGSYEGAESEPRSAVRAGDRGAGWRRRQLGAGWREVKVRRVRLEGAAKGCRRRGARRRNRRGAEAGPRGAEAGWGAGHWLRQAARPRLPLRVPRAPAASCLTSLPARQVGPGPRAPGTGVEQSERAGSEKGPQNCGRDRDQRP